MTEQKINAYALSRAWFDFCFENPEKIKPNHTAMYFFCIEHCNRLGWKKKFGLPSTMVMDAIGIRSYNTYINTLRDLVDFGFVNMIEKSKNQYSSNIIALSYFNKSLDKALDKALIKHATKQSESTIQSTSENIDSIIKQITSNQLTSLQINKLTSTLEEFHSSKNKELKIINPEIKKPLGSEKKKSSAKKRKEEISPECKQYFLDYYKAQKGVDFYWSAAEATALNQLIQKIRTISNESDDNKLKDLFFTFIGKIKAADDWVYENLSIKIMNSKFNELIPKMKSVNAAGNKTKIPSGYEALLQKHQNIIKNGKS